ncbi:unnamed protein product [Symbiodinium sp. CCMP2592]|nr:unnamed protein product [Symbiodinium sp. CCMP2592]
MLQIHDVMSCDPPRHLIQAKVDSAAADAEFLAQRTRYTRDLRLDDKDAESLRKLTREAAELLMTELPPLGPPEEMRRRVSECLSDPFLLDFLKGLKELIASCHLEPNLVSMIRMLPHHAVQEILSQHQQAARSFPYDASKFAMRVRSLVESWHTSLKEEAVAGGAAAKQEEKEKPAKPAEPSETPAREAEVVEPPAFAKKVVLPRAVSTAPATAWGMTPGWPPSYPQWPYGGAANYNYWAAWAASAAQRQAKKSKRRRSKKDKKDKDDNVKSKKRRRKVQKKKSTSSSSSSSSEDGDEGSGAAAAVPAVPRVSAAQAKQRASAPGVSERFSDLMLGIEEEDSEGEPKSGSPGCRTTTLDVSTLVDVCWMDQGAEKAEPFDPEAPPKRLANSEKSRQEEPPKAQAGRGEPLKPPAPSQTPQPGAAVDPGDAEKVAKRILHQGHLKTSQHQRQISHQTPEDNMEQSALVQPLSCTRYAWALAFGVGRQSGGYFSKLKEELPGNICIELCRVWDIGVGLLLRLGVALFWSDGVGQMAFTTERNLPFDLDFEQLVSVRLKDQAPAQGVLGTIDPLFWEVCGVKQLGHRLLFAKGLRALPPGPQRAFSFKPVNSHVALQAPDEKKGQNSKLALLTGGGAENWSLDGGWKPVRKSWAEQTELSDDGAPAPAPASEEKEGFDPQYFLGEWLDNLGHRIVVTPASQKFVGRRGRRQNGRQPQMAFTASLQKMGLPDKRFTISLDRWQQWRCGNGSLVEEDSNMESLTWAAEDGRVSNWERPVPDGPVYFDAPPAWNDWGMQGGEDYDYEYGQWVAVEVNEMGGMEGNSSAPWNFNPQAAEFNPQAKELLGIA